MRKDEFKVLDAMVGQQRWLTGLQIVRFGGGKRDTIYVMLKRLVDKGWVGQKELPGKEPRRLVFMITNAGYEAYNEAMVSNR